VTRSKPGESSGRGGVRLSEVDSVPKGNPIPSLKRKGKKKNKKEVERGISSFISMGKKKEDTEYPNSGRVKVGSDEVHKGEGKKGF